MEWEDQDEEHEEQEEEEEEGEGDAIPITSYDPLHPNSSADAQPLKMPTHSAIPETRSSSSSSPPPSPLSLSIPPMMSTAKKPAARYRECLKNHAVGIGGHAVDGCCEFMPAGAEGTIDALRCAACNCHRNFHRKEVDPIHNPVTQNHQAVVTPIAYYPHHQPPPHPAFQFQTYSRASPGYQQRPLALPPAGSGGGGEERERELMMISNPMAAMGLGSSGKKRFRTKFTAEQKEKMLELAEKIGWRLQKQDEETIQQFCQETGLKRKVLKVWMHNNKQTYLGKKP